MKIRLILIGMATFSLLPLAAANAGAIPTSALWRVGTDADLSGIAGPRAENFGRDENDKGDHDKGGYDKDGYDKDGYDKDGYDRHGHDRHGHDRHDHDHDGDDHHGDKSPSKPY